MAENNKPIGWKEMVWKQIEKHVMGGKSAKELGSKSGKAIKKQDKN